MGGQLLNSHSFLVHLSTFNSGNITKQMQGPTGSNAIGPFLLKQETLLTAAVNKMAKPVMNLWEMEPAAVEAAVGRVDRLFSTDNRLGIPSTLHRIRCAPLSFPTCSFTGGWYQEICALVAR